MERSNNGSRVEPEQVTVSVCIPAYRAETFLAETIESVLAQTYQDWELIILDNNSPDRTGKIARSYHDERIVVARNEETLSMADNWNAVSAMATGTYLKLLCADDIIHPDCLAEQVRALDTHPAVSVVASKRDFIGADGDVVLRDRGLVGLIGEFQPDDVVKRVVGSGINPVGWPAAMLFRRQVFVDVGAFDASWFYPIDLELAIRMLRGGSFYGSARSLASFRISPTSASATTKKHGKQHREMLKAVAADEHWNVPRRVLLRGLFFSHLETAKKYSLFSAANSRWSAVRRLPALFLQPLHKSVMENERIAVEVPEHATSVR